MSPGVFKSLWHPVFIATKSPGHEDALRFVHPIKDLFSQLYIAAL